MFFCRGRAFHAPFKRPEGKRPHKYDQMQIYCLRQNYLVLSVRAEISFGVQNWAIEQVQGPTLSYLMPSHNCSYLPFNKRSISLYLMLLFLLPPTHEALSKLWSRNQPACRFLALFCWLSAARPTLSQRSETTSQSPRRTLATSGSTAYHAHRGPARWET